MNLSPTLESYLNHADIAFDILEHPRSNSSMQTAHAAHITPWELAKAVIVKGPMGYMMCLLPASNRLIMNWLDRDYNGHFSMASESELSELFPDCESGAVPSLGQAYGLKVVWDNALRHSADIFMEAGDHRHLVHVLHDEFMELMQGEDYAKISCSPETVEYYQHIH